MTVHVSVRSISALLLPGIVLTPEIPLSELQKYVGHYRDAAGAAEFTILVRNQRLAVRLPNNASFDLLPPDATTYSDYREVGGMRAPHSYIESTEIGGRMKSQVERVEVGVELAPDTFALQPSTESGQRR